MYIGGPVSTPEQASLFYPGLSKRNSSFGPRIRHTTVRFAIGLAWGGLLFRQLLQNLHYAR